MLNKIFRLFNQSRKLDLIYISLKSSFFHIKEDIIGMKEWMTHLTNNHIEHEKAIRDLKQRIEILESHTQNNQHKYIEETVKGPNISSTQELICNTLAALQNERGIEWISLKEIAQECYTNIDYNKIRSTLSEYTSNLEELGILVKKRIRKQTYIKFKESFKNKFLKNKKVKVDQ